MPSPIRTATPAIALLTVGFYWWIFLAQPLVEGNADLSRALFVLTSVLYPEGYMIGSWTDDGRLPLAFFDRLPIIGATLLWLAIAALVGWPWCVRPSKSNTRPVSVAARLVELSLACLCGLAMLSTLTLLIGLAGGLGSRWPLLVSIVALAAISHFAARYGRSSELHGLLPESVASDGELSLPPQNLFQRVITNAVIVATVWLGAVIMLGSWVPPREFDVVEYHLQAPKEFYQAGHIGFVPHNIYANMPLGAEMHTLAAMTILQQDDTWLGGLVGKSITAAVSIIGALLLGGWVAQRMGSFSGWTAAGIWLGTPGITHVATLGLIDGVLATYVLATALTTLAWFKLAGNAEVAREPGQAVGGLRVVSLLAGATAALKYPGLIYATLPCLAIIAIHVVRLIRAQQSAAVVRLVLITLLGLSLTCLPWYAKNWWLAGNPVYPLAASVFGGRTLTPEKIAQWQAAHRVPLAAPADASLPQQIIGTAQRLSQDFSRLMLTSPFVQPTLIIGLVCAVVWLWQRRRPKPTSSIVAPGMDRSLWILLIWSMWILLVWWLATHRIDRFWLPVTGLWSALAAWGLWQVRQRSLPVAQTMLVSGLFYAVLICSSPVVTDNRYFVSLAALRDDVGDDNHLPRVPLVQAWINQNLSSPDTRVLLIGEARVFEYRVDVVYSTCFDTNPGQAWLSGTDATEQRSALSAAGITHVLINWSEIERYRSPGNYGFSAWPEPSHIEQLIRDQVLEPIDWGAGSDRVQLLKVPLADGR